MVNVTPLVTLGEAKIQLEIPEMDDSQDEKIEMMLGQATAIVMDYIDDPDRVWNVNTAPEHVKGAVLWQLAWMYRHRGDEVDTPSLAPGIAGENGILWRTRKIAIA